MLISFSVVHFHVVFQCSVADCREHTIKSVINAEHGDYQVRDYPNVRLVVTVKHCQLQ